MTILNLPDLLDPDQRKDKRKNNKRKIQQMTARFWCILRPLITPADEQTGSQTPLGSEDTVFHYSANFFNRNDFRLRLSPLFLHRGIARG